jgi:hypothetical protein
MIIYLFIYLINLAVREAHLVVVVGNNCKYMTAWPELIYIWNERSHTGTGIPDSARRCRKYESSKYISSLAA